MNIEELRKVNGSIIIDSVLDESFKPYGKIVKDLDVSLLIDYAKKNVTIPKTGNEYSASVKELENMDVIKKIKDRIYGQLDIEAGTCSGQNTLLTGVEYHQGSEVTIAVTDCVLILGKLQDMNKNTYDSNKAKFFYVKSGTVVELYGTTLHYTPCKVNENGFITIVVLIRGTNSLIEKTEESILTKKNKYFITHSSQTQKIKTGAYPGLLGGLVGIKIK